ncbi:pilus assembly protein [Caldibacillus lycopersici]|uniref:Pilus assembly protein n=1 Tax=Perspicuibacillus lycopersici TaxID=1325689 RepID=A0AAE3ISS5_9BACI|nr:TadE/TadG family type IV pilus assembly protein [Perspicuibacillus lycopersici]MCU9613532.1 pilus assembly protein [Perspicuibacillus lycopersici]
MVKSQKGQATVELAISLTLLMFILFAIIDFGRMFHVYLTLDNASREAARAAVVGQADIDIIQVVNKTSTTLDSTKINVSISPSKASRTRGTYATVELTYPFSFSVPIFNKILPETIDIKAKTVMRVE